MGQPHYFPSMEDNSSFLFTKAKCHNLWIKILALYSTYHCYYYHASSSRNTTFCSVPTSSKPKVKLHPKNYIWLNWNVAETQTQHEEFNSLKNHQASRCSAVLVWLSHTADGGQYCGAAPSWHILSELCWLQQSCRSLHQQRYALECWTQKSS